MQLYHHLVCWHCCPLSKLHSKQPHATFSFATSDFVLFQDFVLFTTLSFSRHLTLSHTLYPGNIAAVLLAQVGQVRV